MFRKFALLAVFGLLAPAPCRADVKPNSLCTDGMVLQQKMDVNIWGTAVNGEKVTVSFRGKTATTTADNNGHWKVSLPSGEAGGPLPMTIAGNNKLEYTNVYVGEVWICSGQSNMQWSVSACDKTDQQSASDTPPNKMLRLFYVQRVPQAKPADDVIVQKVDKEGPNWTDAEPNTAMPFSAVAYFFGRDLQAALKVPVGLIHTSWGGTRAEAWTSREVLDRHPSYKGEPQPGEKLQPNIASVLYNGMIHPLLNYRIKGAIWYQGESNVGKAYAYRELFPMMIQNWRTDWKQGDFPFLFVQLAPFLDVKKEPGESAWAELREAQALTLKLPHTGMAVITDYGHERDIHPTPKRPVGERLAFGARAQVYGEKIAYSGPMFKEMKVDGNKAVLNFDHVGGGLVAKELVPTDERKNKIKKKDGKEIEIVGYAWRVKEGSSKAELLGFAVCGTDKKFHNAKAEIAGNTVVVTCDATPNIVAVRYGWADHPICNLFNREGLPASPFRTDDLPGITKK
jgi:sialate O-acetylesterase